MKTIKTGLIIGIIFILLIVCNSSLAQENIIEVPDTRIIIDGVIISFPDVPLSINNRTMLPLRALLLNLGVRDEDIIWDGEEKSVTIINDETRIILKIGNTLAMVDNTPVQMDVAPLGYSNQRVYIPLRFVSQNLGMKVTWDGLTKTIYIRREQEYNQVKEIIEKSNSAMSQMEKVRINGLANTLVSGRSSDISLKIDMLTEINRLDRLMYTRFEIPLLDKNIELETFYSKNASYSKNPITGEWGIEDMGEEEFNNVLESNYNPVAKSGEDTLYSGLIIDDSQYEMIILKGNVYLRNLFERMSQNLGGDNPLLKEFYTEIAIDRNTFLIEYINMDISGSMASEEGTTAVRSRINCRYKEYNGQFDVRTQEI